MARKRLTALRYRKEIVEDVSRLVELHLRFHGYGEGEWTDSAVRRYVTDAGPLLTRLHALTRADCTTRNKAKALRLEQAYDDLEARISRAGRAGGAGQHPAGPGRQRDHGDPGHPAGTAGRPGLPVPEGAAASSTGPLDRDAAVQELLALGRVRRAGRTAAIGRPGRVTAS